MRACSAHARYTHASKCSHRPSDEPSSVSNESAGHSSFNVTSAAGVSARLNNMYVTVKLRPLTMMSYLLPGAVSDCTWRDARSSCSSPRQANGAQPCYAASNDALHRQPSTPPHLVHDNCSPL